MPDRRLRAARLAEIYQRIREKEELPMEFPPEALREAKTRAESPLVEGEDLRQVPFVTIDPPDANDLDQAIAFEERSGGRSRLRYAIADIPGFVVPGGPLDAEARRRGTTVYCPDHRIPLHPITLSEDAASLLPGQDRPAIVWELDVDADGEVERHDVRRAIVRSRERFDYETVQR
ncbi:MAG: ribonuclease catalytic domain-containing protein, partial [Acidimicrobiia bacterium]